MFPLKRLLRVPSQIPLLLLISIFLLSCGAKKASERLTVKAPKDFHGIITLTTCDSTAPADEIQLDAAGAGRTSRCSASPDLTVVVIRGATSTEVPAQSVKTGDGVVVSIRAEVK